MLGAIQAGGRSARMGADKAWLTLGGRPLIARALDAARGVVDRLIIVLHRDDLADDLVCARYARLGRERGAGLVEDHYHRLGPLGGIQTALSECRDDEPALVLACDLPFITPEFLALLARRHLASPSRGGPAATVPSDQMGRRQPLAAIYDRSCQEVIAPLLAAGRLRLDELLARIAVNPVSAVEYAHLPGADRLLLNLNTPEDYRAALQLAAEEDGGSADS
jgi:molybdopterin-guanine dinucleotide biosynthesis protein A